MSEEKKIVRVNVDFYRKCLDKLHDAIYNHVFTEDTELDEVYTSDVLILLGGYLQFLGQAASTEEPEDQSDIVYKMVDDLTEIWDMHDISEHVAAMGMYVYIIGDELSRYQGTLGNMTDEEVAFIEENLAPLLDENGNEVELPEGELPGEFEEVAPIEELPLEVSEDNAVE